jgi:SAM-dependent methyltransferase
MNLQELQWNWNQFGKEDPLYAILTHPDKKENRWDQQEFFKTGEDEVKSLIDYITSLHVPITFRRALDFGCGVGRLTQALCGYFDNCDGVDIAPSMVDLANKFNSFGDRCQYHVNISDDLQLFDANTFDFIYSMIVLQHIEPKYIIRYIEEFIRVLKPGGIAVFQIPSELQITQNEPLPEGAYSASICPLNYPAEMSPGERFEIRVRLQNTSAFTWLGDNGRLLKHPIRLGNHWLGSDGTVVRMNDARTPLETDLGPTEEIDMSLTVTTPLIPGQYILELDMVQERVCWFHQKESTTTQFPVQVLSEEDLAFRHFASAAPELSPKAEMHCVPRTDVVALVQSNGASIVDIQEDFMARPAFVGYRYCIRKQSESVGAIRPN